MVDTIPNPGDTPNPLFLTESQELLAALDADALREVLKHQTQVTRYLWDLREQVRDAMGFKPHIVDDALAYNIRDLRTELREQAATALEYQQRFRQPTGYPVEVISFGYLHGEPPAAERVVDVRETLHDPAAARHVLDMDGRDTEVRNVVWDTPGAVDLVDDLMTYALALPHDRLRRIAIGCAGGRHRSVALADFVAEALRDNDIPTMVRHRDVHRPRVLPTSEGDQR